MSRPPAHEAPPDCIVVARPADDRWAVVDGKYQCSRISGPGKVRCERVAVAELNRPRHTRRGTTIACWYMYCADHLADYGRWVEDGDVMEWVSVPVETAQVTL